jgi:hypothetical protein
MSDTYNTRNYAAHGGGEWVIGGKLTFLPDATVEGLPAAVADVVGGVKLAANQVDSTASTIAGLNIEFNALLAKLKAAGIMAPDA